MFFTLYPLKEFNNVGGKLQQFHFKVFGIILVEM